jgi:hypothetical protein
MVEPGKQCFVDPQWSADTLIMSLNYSIEVATLMSLDLGRDLKNRANAFGSIRGVPFILKANSKFCQ